MDKKMRKHKSKQNKVVNALDYPNMELFAFPSDSSMAELSLDMENMPFSESVERIPSYLTDVIDRVDIWEEVKKHLTSLEFQAFELMYRYQYRHGDIIKIMNIKGSSLTKCIKNATIKLQKVFSIKPQN